MEQIDFLTGFLSKEVIDITLDKVKAECDIDKKSFSVLILDLDHFKTYNDKYGHLDGDDLLRYFAGTLRLSLDMMHTYIFRFGGDEFIVVFPGKKEKEVYHIARELLKVVKKHPFLSRGRICKLNFSAGIASYPADGRNIEGVIQKADRAMYFSKEHGRGTVTIYSNIFRQTIEKVSVFIIAIFLTVGTLWLLNKSSYKGQAITWLKEKTGKIEATLLRRTVKMNMEEPDLVYLRSGRILKGTIIRDDKDEIEVSLSFNAGKGTITVKRSDIARIVKR